MNGGEQRLAVLGKLDHARQHIDVLVRLASRATAFAVDLEDEQLRVNLRQNTFALDDFRTTHVRTHLESLTDKIVEGIMNGIN